MFSFLAKLLPAEAGYAVIALNLRGLDTAAKLATGYGKRHVAHNVHELGWQLA